MGSPRPGTPLQRWRSSRTATGAPRSRSFPGTHPSGAARGAFRLGAALLLGAAGVSPSVGVAQERFSVEDVLSAPFASGIVAAPAGDRVAWVLEREGRRNVMVADGPEFEARAVTDFQEDDGQELGSLLFTSDGERLVFVRGGAPNRSGEIPNPLSDPAGADRAIWTVALDGTAPTLRTEGASPVVAPDGETLAFVRDGRVWTVSLVGEEEPEELMEVRGGVGSLRWSPDGSTLAFVSSRGDHAFVGLLDVEERRIRWLDPGVDRDGSPAWSPDGSRLAFLRIPSQKDRLPFFPRREALPFSIRVADVATGRVREVFRADEGTGSAFQGVEAENELLWGAGDRIVFPWEREGWTHLWSVPASGGEPRLLTPGEAEVQHVALSADRRRVLYSSNLEDVDRKHLWSVPVEGGEEPRLLTPGDGIEWSPVETPGGTVAFLASGARTPAHAARLGPDGEAVPLAPETVPERFPGEALVVPEAVVFPAADGLPIHGQLFLPPDVEPGDRRPGVLFFHGGSRRQMLLGFHHRGYYHNAYALNQYLANQGYVVLSVNYRSGIGYGMEFREAERYGASGGSELQDVLGAGLWMASRPDVDPDRIGLWGGSYGGYLTALGLARASHLFAAGVDFHGVHDWNAGIRNFVSSYDPLEDPERTRVALEASPMGHLDTWRSPVLLVHGDDDRNVAFTETVELVEALRERGVTVETLVFPDEVHGFLLHRSWLAAYRATADFLDRHLRGQGARATN